MDPSGSSSDRPTPKADVDRSPAAVPPGAGPAPPGGAPVPTGSPRRLSVVGPDHLGPVDLDTGSAGREEVAIAVAALAASGPAGPLTVRTAQVRAARRAAHVIGAIVAARSEDRA